MIQTDKIVLTRFSSEYYSKVFSRLLRRLGVQQIVSSNTFQSFKDQYSNLEKDLACCIYNLLGPNCSNEVVIDQNNFKYRGDIHLFLSTLKKPLIIATHFNPPGLDESIKLELNARGVLHIPFIYSQLRQSLEEFLK